jgi:hypothetical protein
MLKSQITGEALSWYKSCYYYVFFVFGSAEEAEQSKGFITFSLSNGPEYHISQVTSTILILF